jgi:hypothetical protein
MAFVSNILVSTAEWGKSGEDILGPAKVRATRGKLTGRFAQQYEVRDNTAAGVIHTFDF